MTSCVGGAPKTTCSNALSTCSDQTHLYAAKTAHGRADRLRVIRISTIWTRNNAFCPSGANYCSDWAWLEFIGNKPAERVSVAVRFAAIRASDHLNITHWSTAKALQTTQVGQMRCLGFVVVRVWKIFITDWCFMVSASLKLGKSWEKTGLISWKMA